jgi:hypothetical protein
MLTDLAEYVVVDSDENRSNILKNIPEVRRIVR